MSIDFYWDKEGCYVTKVENKDMCVLFSLSDGSTFKIGIPLDELENLLQMELTSNFANIDLSIFLHKFEMTANQWKIIYSTLRESSEVTKAFAGHLKLQKLIELSYNKLCQLPTRLYGGYSRGLYLSYPLNFRKIPNNNCYSNLFSDKEYIVRVVLDKKYNIVEIGSGVISPTHYIGDYYV